MGRRGDEAIAGRDGAQLVKMIGSAKNAMLLPSARGNAVRPVETIDGNVSLGQLKAPAVGRLGVVQWLKAVVDSDTAYSHLYSRLACLLSQQAASLCTQTQDRYSLGIFCLQALP
jgi:hypothetical protein